MVLLFLQPLLDYFCSCDYALLHLLHHLVLYLACNWSISDWLTWWQSSFFKEWSQKCIFVIIFGLLLDYISVLAKLLTSLVIQGFLNDKSSISNSFVLLESAGLHLPYGLISLLFHFQKFLVLLLYNWIVILFFVCIDFSKSKYLIPRIFFFDGLNLSFVHVIVNEYFLFHKINCNLSYLLFCCLLRILLKLTRHFLDLHFSNVIIIIIWVLSGVKLILVSPYKANTLGREASICVLVKFDGFFPNFLYSFNEAIGISIWIVVDYPHSSINLSYFFPVRHFPRTVILHCLELKRISILFLEFIASVMVEITHLLNFYLLVVLNHKIKNTSYWVYLSTNPSGWL
jgi:hypothetical protein